MSPFTPTPSARQLNIGLTILRVVLGITFMMHGGQKLFVMGIDTVSGGFTQMGFPAPAALALLVSLVEFLGGIALVLGLLTRVAALGLCVDMIVAILVVHLKNGFFNPGGVEFPLALLGASALLGLTGAGAFSLDALVSRRSNRTHRPLVPVAHMR